MVVMREFSIWEISLYPTHFFINIASNSLQKGMWILKNCLLHVYAINPISSEEIKLKFCDKIATPSWDDRTKTGGKPRIDLFCFHHNLWLGLTICVYSLPLHSYYKMCVWDWSLSATEPISYARLRVSWLSFLDLLHYGDAQKNAFSCFLCKEEPNVIICDGITLSLQRRFLKTQTQIAHEKRLVGLE